MLLELHPPSDNLSDEHAHPGFLWEAFDFEMCNSFQVSKVCWIFCTILCSVTGFPACVAILWELFKRHHSGTPLTPNSFFILHLTIMDAVFLAIIPAGVLNHLIWKAWAIEATWNALFALNMCGRPLLMACVCLDCYVAVVHPITYHKRKSMTPRIVMVCIVWAWTAAFAVAFFLFYKFYGLYSTLSFVIAVVTVGMCDCSILRALVKSDASRKNIHLQKQRAVQTLINSLVVTMFSYIPPLLLEVIGRTMLIDFRFFMCVIEIPASILSSSGSAIMPNLHLLNRKKPSLFGCSLDRIRCCGKRGHFDVEKAASS